MNDLEYDAMQKKRIARGAYAKKGGRSKKCTLPDDFLTPAQRRALNGPETTYKLSEPMDWKTFRSMPKELQKEYLIKISDRFHVGDNLMAEMFGCTPSTVSMHRAELGIKRPEGTRLRSTRKQAETFRLWYSSKPIEAEPESEPENETATNPEPQSASAITRLSGGSFTVSGYANEALSLLQSLFRDDCHKGKFTLSFTYEEESAND